MHIAYSLLRIDFKLLLSSVLHSYNNIFDLWLPHGQIWAIIEGKASLTLRPEDHRELRDEVGSLCTAKRLIGILQFIFNALTH